MDSREVADKKLARWKWAYMATLIFPALIVAAYTVYSLAYTPKTRTVLLNQFGGVYVSEDLGQTNVTEGQVKQFAYDILSQTFSYDYLSFSTDSEYQDLVSGKVDTDLPDHRDVLFQLYSPEAHKVVIAKLKDSPWMDRFHVQRRQLSSVFTSPPLQDGNIGFVKGADGRLTISYRGSFFLSSQSKGLKTLNYKVDYRITLERKPLFLDANLDKYYFGPMSPINAFEWRVRDIDWTSGRRG